MGGVIRTVPPRFIHPRKQERKPPKILEQREAAKMLDKTKVPRDRAFLEFMYATGCRLADVLPLRVPNIDLVKRTARVRSKRKERIVYFGKPAATALRKYLKGRKEGYLFQIEYKKQKGHLNKTTKTWVGMYSIYPQGKRIVQYKYMGMLDTTSRAQAKARFKKHLKRVDLSRPIPDRPMCKHTAWKMLRNAARRIKRDFLPARTIRHSYATHLCENGADIRTIQELLGHSCLSSTQIYLQLANKRVARIYNKSHPRR
jgi:integrase/recombinase XerD